MTNTRQFDLRRLARIRIANGTVGANTLRSQGAAGLIAATRVYLAQDLIFEGLEGVTSEAKYGAFLQTHTLGLLAYWRTPAGEIKSAERKARKEALRSDPAKPRRALVPSAIGSWAAARKCLNIYVLSARLSAECGWPKRVSDNWLELPIDKKVASCLRDDFWLLPASRRDALIDEHDTVRSFKGLKSLQEVDHESFQSVAREVARCRRTSRPFLDLAYYEPGEREDD